MKRWNIVLTGFGTVGREIARLLEQRRDRYRQLYQADVRLVGAARSTCALYDPEGLPREQLEAFAQRRQPDRPGWDATEWLSTVEADVLMEAGPSDVQTGGPGLRYLRQALASGMHAIAVSKGALVVDYAGLSALAKAKGVQLKISGATAAALPTIDLFAYNLAGCEIKQVEGIFTGTANFVLTSVMEEGITSEEAIRRAQQMGIAEPDPAYDIDGWDTAAKIAILANAVFGAKIKLSDIPRASIRDLSPAQMAEWKRAGRMPKLIGTIRRTRAGVEAAVELVAVEATHPFAGVSKTTKAIRVETDVMGELMVVGGKSDPVAAAAAALKDLEHLLSG
ncbi:homoserine dehydrogenase [Brevibacillus sp. SAFN-007a]|uniref:homoserine dehydrogenase n=1 Tax=Brevibacillus sp. SAFN-007a TaxID=3436862 RepID=UPI003F7F3D1F